MIDDYWARIKCGSGSGIEGTTISVENPGNDEFKICGIKVFGNQSEFEIETALYWATRVFIDRN